jgi:hypothetical protein
LAYSPQAGSLIVTHIFSFAFVLVLNEMVLVLVIVIESVLSVEHEHRLATEH